MSSVLSPATSVGPSRGMLTKQKNIVSEQIKKCSLKEVEFNEEDITKLKAMKNILDDKTINEVEKKKNIKMFIDNNQKLLFTPRPILNGKTIMHIIAIGSINPNSSLYFLLYAASFRYSDLNPININKLIIQIISILDNNIINKKDPLINCMDDDNKTPLDYACENSKNNPNPIMKNILEYDNYCNTKVGGKKTQIKKQKKIKRKTQRKNKKQKKSV